MHCEKWDKKKKEGFSTMKRGLRKGLSIFLSIALLLTAFSGISFAEEKGKENFNAQTLIQKVREARTDALKEHSLQARSSGGSTPSGADNQKVHKPEDMVRVIIQLEDSSVYEKLGGAKKRSIQSFSTREADQLQSQLSLSQNEVIKRIKESKSSFQERYRFTRLVNGLSGDVKYKEIERLKQIPGVADVKIANLYYPTKAEESKPQMFFSAPLIGAESAWNESGYDGTGTVVAVLDSGVNYFHPAFGGNGTETLRLGGKEDLTGKGGYNAKVIGGYNWADGNNDIVDRTESQHGVHVAGTVAGHDQNTTVEGKEFKGVAPGAKILAEKIFSNDAARSGTMSDEIIAGIEHAIAHDADVINMSIGSPAGAVTADDPELIAIERAAAAGIVLSISAGNEGVATSGLHALPLAQNPDFGMVGSPGVASSSISVAASMNSDALFPYFTLSQDLGLGKVPMSVPEVLPPPSTLHENYGIVDVGLGAPTDYTGKDVAGKVALIKRGTYPFSEKVANAAHAGAVAAIIYNNDSSGFINMAVNGDEGIPAGFILKEHGDRIAEALKNNTDLKLTFGAAPAGFPLKGDTMTDFSSWGPESGLLFKPTLTAPGGNIYSSVGKNGYASFNGTSMAAPHVAGASALVIQSFRENDRYTGYTPQDVRAALANTAKLLADSASGVPYPVRQQGAGRIQVDQAVKTDVLVTDQSGEPGAALKAFSERSKSFTLQLKNIGDQAYTYTLGSNGVYQEATANGYQTMSLAGIEGSSVQFSADHVTVPAKGRAQVTVTVTLPENLPQNQFVEGWVTFTADEGQQAPALSVPFFGFYGDWNAPKVVDRHWSKADSYYGYTGLYDDSGLALGTYLETKTGNPPITEQYGEGMDAFSPNGDLYMDQTLPVFSLLRNAEHFQINVLDQEKKVIRKLDGYEQLRKDDEEVNAPLTLAAPWDGTLDGKKVPDGQYYIQYLSKPYGVSGAALQEELFPVKVDTENPTVSLTVEKSGGKATLKMTGSDQGAGISNFAVFTYNPYLEKSDLLFVVPVSDGNGGFTAELTNLPSDETYEVVAVDYAGNMSVASEDPFFYGGIQKSDADQAAVTINWQADPAKVTAIKVKVDEGKEISLDPKVYSAGYPAAEPLPLTYGLHTISVQALSNEEEIFAITDHVKINAVSLQSDKALTVYDEEQAQIDYVITSPRVNRLVFTSDGGTLKEVAFNPENAWKDLTYQYLPSMGSHSVTIDAYANDELLGKAEMRVNREKTYDVRFDTPYYFADDQQSLEIGFAVSEEVYKADLVAEDSDGNKFIGPISVYEASQGVTHATYALDISSWPQGHYTLKLIPYDESGNPESLQEDTATLEKVPTGILQYPMDGGYAQTDQDSYTLTWAYDEGAQIPSGATLKVTVAHMDINGARVNEDVYQEIPVIGADEKQLTSYSVDLTGYQDGDFAFVTLEAKDGDKTIVGTLYYIIVKDLSAPTWYVIAPAPYDFFNKKSRSGTFQALTFDRDLDPASVTLEIQGQDPASITPDDYGVAYAVEKGFTLVQEGLQNVTLRYKDQVGHEGYFARKVYADFTAPEIRLRSPWAPLTPVAGREDAYEASYTTTGSDLLLSGLVKENMSSFDFWVNDEKSLSLIPSKAYVKDTVDERPFSLVYPLAEGMNEITLRAVDGAGNETTLLLHVMKVTSSVSPGEGQSGGGQTPPPTTDTGTIDTPAGKVTTTTKEDGRVEAKVEVSAQAVTDQLNQSGSAQVRLDLTKVDLNGIDQLSLTMEKETAQKLLDSGKGLLIQLDGVDVETPAAILSAFIGEDGSFTLTIKVEDPKEAGSVQIQAIQGASVVSPILTIGEAGKAVNEPITLTFKLRDGAAKDPRKVAPYSRSAAGIWSYIGSLKDRKGNQFTVKTATLGTYALVEYNKSFSDIDGHWAQDAIEVMASQHVAKGMTEALFKPEASVTRAEFAALLVRTLGLAAASNFAGTFSDVKANDWFAGVVETAAAAGIVQGSNGQFKPNATITREEMTVMIIRALGLEKEATGLAPAFADAESVSGWAKGAVALAAQRGYVNGMGNNLFAPKGSSKRAEAITILFRLIDTLQK